MQITRLATPPSSRCGKSGTVLITRPSGKRCCPIDRQAPAPAVACAGACDVMVTSASNNVITTDAACPAADNNSQSVVIIIPTLNEEASIGEVVRTLPFDLVGRVIVADGGSTDRTAERARASGA